MLPTKRLRVGYPTVLHCRVQVGNVSIAVLTVKTHTTEPVTQELMDSLHKGERHFFDVAHVSIAGAPCPCGGACCGCCVLNASIAGAILQREQ